MKLSHCLVIAVVVTEAFTLFWDISYGTGTRTGITYQLYTKRNPVNGQPLIYGNLNSVAVSNFDNNKPTR